MTECKGQCDVTIVMADDYRDNETTFHCQLQADHIGRHKETGDMGWDGDGKRVGYSMPYTLTWEGKKHELEATYGLND